MKEKQLLIRIDESLKNKLASTAKMSNRTMSDYVRLIIEQAVKNKTKV